MSVSVLNTTAGLSGKTLALLEGSQTFTGQKTFDVGASAPFVVVAGAAKVANLDADKLDGETGVDYHNAALLTGLAPLSSDVTEQTATDTGAVNNFAPSAGNTVVIRCTGAAPVFSGFTGGVAGRRIILQCLGTTLKVTDQATSTAANQIICDSTQGQIVGVNGAILLIYDDTTDRWRASLLEAGAPITFTPTWTGSGSNPAIGNGTMTGKYIQRGKMCQAQFRVTAGGTTTFGTGDYYWALPLTAADADAIRMVGDIIDNGTGIYPAWGRPSAAGTTTLKIAAGATAATNGTVSQTLPMTWASGDQIVLGGEYEIA